MANQTITQLPAAGPITGTELVPIVQNGGTYRTTTGAIANSPTLNQTFVTQSQEVNLTNSRYLSVDTGLQLTDGGSLSFLRIGMTGAASSLNAASSGFIVKDSANTVVSRSLTTSGTGLSISNPDGTGANPIFSLTGTVASLANFPGVGVLALRPGNTIAALTVTGTANQIAVTDGDGQAGNPTIGIASNPVLPGTGSVKVPGGTTAQQPVGSNGEFRYNTDLAAFEGYAGGSWQAFPIGTGVNTFSAGTTGFSPSSPTTGSIVLTGTLNVSNGGTGATTLTGYVKGNGTSAMTAAATVPHTDVSGLGTIATQNSNSVAITGGAITGATINNAVIGGTTPAAATFTSVATTTGTISTLPTNANDLVNKQYVDEQVAAGLNVHTAVKYEVPNTTGNLNATYNNGVAGVGATLTNAGALAAFAPDGPTAMVGDRVLVYNQTNQFENGVYEVSVVGNGSTAWVLTRTSDTDTYGANSSTKLGQGSYFFVTSGNTGAGESYTCTTSGPITFGTTAITFAQFSASVTYSAGTGLNLSPSTTFNISNTGVSAGAYGSTSSALTLNINAQGQITSASSAAIAITSGQVSGLAASATTDTTNANNITSGTLDSGRLTGSYTGITGVGTLTAGTWNANAIGVAYGGTGLTTTPANGQLAIGNGTGYSLANLTAGTNVSITNTAGGITISATPAAGGTVTSVDVSGGTTGLTTSGGPITVSGTITLGGTLNVANGGTGATTLTGYVKGTGTSALTASSSIPNTDITGLGSMSTQNSTSVAITGGSIDGTTVGSTTAATVRGTTVTATTDFSGPGTNLTGTAAGLSIGGNAATATTATNATNVAGGSAGAIPYNTAASTTTFLNLGTSGYVLTAGASAPAYVAQSTLSVGSATNATNTTNIGITDDTSTNATMYPVWVTANTGNLPAKVTSTKLSFNPSTGQLTATGGISGGVF
jgi:hypothetical protein